MPDHVRNRFTIFGPARDVARFVLQSQTSRLRSGDATDRSTWITADEITRYLAQEGEIDACD